MKKFMTMLVMLIMVLTSSAQRIYKDYQYGTARLQTEGFKAGYRGNYGLIASISKLNDDEEPIRMECCAVCQGGNLTGFAGVVVTRPNGQRVVLMQEGSDIMAYKTVRTRVKRDGNFQNASITVVLDSRGYLAVLDSKRVQLMFRRGGKNTLIDVTNNSCRTLQNYSNAFLKRMLSEGFVQ